LHKMHGGDRSCFEGGEKRERKSSNSLSRVTTPFEILSNLDLKKKKRGHRPL